MSDYEFHEDVLKAGRKGQIRDDVQDFSVDPVDGIVHARKLLVHEWGDAPDMGFGRMGPDNAPQPPNEGAPQECLTGANGGTWYWRFWEHALGWQRRAAQIYCRKGPHGSGSLHLATAYPDPNGTTIDGQMVDRIVLENDGTLSLPGVPFDGQRFRIRLPDGSIAYLRVER